MHTHRLPLLAALLAAGCASHELDAQSIDLELPPSPIAGAEPADHLIQPGEKHFKHLWKLTSGGENAEGYFNPAGDRLSFQRTTEESGCDEIYVTEPGGGYRSVSNGKGVTTCSYFMPDGKHVLYASTQSEQDDCPPRPDMSQGYTWPIHSAYEIYVQELSTGEERLLIGGPGYDAEATVSPKGDRIVFTSTRSGDIELWTCDIEGGDLRQVTHEPGYDGGAFFSHDGEWLVFRTTAFTPGKEAEEIADFERLRDMGLVRPGAMEVMVCRVDGSERRRVTNLGEANWAPYFFPNDKRIIFSSNHDWSGEGPINFDLWAIDVDGENLERITTYDQGAGSNFDAFPMFSPDGKYLVFGSNRGGAKGETNLFIAEWK
ncbi:MAG: PD40 domain-containing protein [Planctomycetes bacterium]|nr:PD40 domain-containing protein [Planctomycetota bacterium]MCB9905316.1 PD40 domain-containing protein [Planctomycetota bacterium]